jgi:hypothetical protein
MRTGCCQTLVNFLQRTAVLHLLSIATAAFHHVRLNSFVHCCFLLFLIQALNLTFSLTGVSTPFFIIPQNPVMLRFYAALLSRAQDPV